ncbi:hypothetical protein KJ068_04030 [bacterium]|nr:hypothetical protein [bacterium]
MANQIQALGWLPEYINEEGFDLPQLLNDDFIEAIKLLFNNKFYISATKLIMSFIDTMAYVEFGDGGGQNFKKWLDTYVDLKEINISSEELWEHRNSLLHMSTLSSRKVSAGKVRRLVAYVGMIPKGCPTEDAEAKWFSLWGLIQVLTQGISKYAQSFGKGSLKIDTFVQRYDQVLSDRRLMYISFSNNG